MQGLVSGMFPDSSTMTEKEEACWTAGRMLDLASRCCRTTAGGLVSGMFPDVSTMTEKEEACWTDGRMLDLASWV